MSRAEQPSVDAGDTTTEEMVEADLALGEVIAAMERVEWSDVQGVGVMEASVWAKRCQEGREKIRQQLENAEIDSVDRGERTRRAE